MYVHFIATNIQKMKKIHTKPWLTISLLIISLTTLQRGCLGQNTNQDYLDVHNAARAQVGVGPIAWDETVADYARSYVSTRLANCSMVHSSGPYGENLAKGSGDFMTARAAVELWVAERSNYDVGSNSCVGGECRHYTQVVWRNSVRLGCARERCNDGWWFVSCNYDPPGNYIGQRPYASDI